MLVKERRGNKKVPLPAAVHLNQAVGPLRLHTGRNYKIYRHCLSIKNARSKTNWRAISPDSNVQQCKCRN